MKRPSPFVTDQTRRTVVAYEHCGRFYDADIGRPEWYYEPGCYACILDARESAVVTLTGTTGPPQP